MEDSSFLFESMSIKKKEPDGLKLKTNILNYDFLGLLNNKVLSRFLQSYGDSLPESLYSETISRINSNMSRKIKQLLVTFLNLYILEPSSKSSEENELKIKKLIPLKSISKVTIPDNNHTILLLTIDGQ